MRTIFKYANGAEEIVETKGNLFPETFGVHTPEDIWFYFRYVDTLPSGTVLFKETTLEESQRIMRGDE